MSLLILTDFSLFSGLTTGCGPASHAGSGPATPGSAAPASNNALDNLDSNLDNLDNLMGDTPNQDTLDVSRKGESDVWS